MTTSQLKVLKFSFRNTLSNHEFTKQTQGYIKTIYLNITLIYKKLSTVLIIIRTYWDVEYFI